MHEFHSPERSVPTPITSKWDYDKKRIHYIERTKHSHLGVEMTLVTSGEALMTIYPADGSAPVTHPVTKGCYTLLTGRNAHSFHRGSSDFTVINFLFNPVLLDPSLPPLAEPEEIERALWFDPPSDRHIPFNRLCVDTDHQISPLFEKSLEIKGKYNVCYRTINRALIIEILMVSLNQTHFPARKTSAGIAQIVREYVDLHYSDPISLTELAGQYHYAPPYVSKCFSEEFGETFRQYLQRVRMEHACDLLLETDHSIEMIAGLVSYSTPIPFRRTFKKHFGVTPNEYRQRAGIIDPIYEKPAGR